MQKYSIIIISMLIISSLCFYAYLHNRHITYTTHTKAAEVTEKKAIAHVSSKPVRVAITLPISHPSLERIQQGFVETLQNSLSQVQYTVYNAQGDFARMRSHTQTAIGKNHDLIFAIATPCAQMAKELIAKTQFSIPVIFSGVTDPAGAGLVHSLEHSGNNLTGVSDMLDHKQQIDILCLLKPQINKIVLVYNAQQAGLSTLAQTLIKYLTDKKKQVHSVLISKVGELYQRIAPVIQQADAVLVLKDNTVVAGIDVLIKLCNQHNVTLMTSDTDSVAKGAALGFGVSEYNLGKKAAEQALLIVLNNTKPTDIPIIHNLPAQLYCNQAACAQQNLSIDKNLLFLMSSSYVISTAL